MGLQCKYCAAAGVRTAWGKGTVGTHARIRPVLKQQMVLHSRSAIHKSAAIKFEGGPADSPLAAAPSCSQFLEVLKCARSGEPKYKYGIKGICKRNKMRKMKWCLAEAHRRVDMSKFKTARTISLMQDVRKGKLLLRFKAVDRYLRVSRGVVGQCTLERGSAHKLTQATYCLLADACTSNKSPPLLPHPLPARISLSTLSKLTHAVEMFAADAAADEQVAGHMLSAQDSGHVDRLG